MKVVLATVNDIFIFLLSISTKKYLYCCRACKKWLRPELPMRFQTHKPCEYWSVCAGHSKMQNAKEHTGTRMCHSRGHPVPTDTHCYCRQTELRGAVFPFSFSTSESKATNLMRHWAHVPTSYELQVSTGIGIRWPESNWLKSYLGKWLPWPQFPQVWNRKYLLCLLHRVIVNIWTHWHNTYKGTLQAVNVTSITLYVIYPISIYRIYSLNNVITLSPPPTLALGHLPTF